MADRIKYDQSQLEKYYDRIGLAASDRKYDIRNLSPDQQLHFLSRLQKQQLITVPFENLTLHYSWHRIVEVSADHLYDKIVNERRGGYCMENNTFFHTVLLTLGYEVYMVGARVFSPDVGKYGGFTHCLNVVTISGASYGVDVGIPQYLRKDQKVWIYEYRSRPEGEWIPQWCFTDYEVLPEDIRVMNMSPSKSPSSFFTFKIMCVLFTSEKEDYSREGKGIDMGLKESGGDVDGGLIIEGDVFKYRKGGVHRWERTFTSEEERLEALRTYFGVEFSKENQRAIRGTSSAIV
ncbi:hypothetical protein F66182_1196 [Fusarium sp. NRRL 66182]|nr:hypothetical protein F66182_1196 [Fusarium sp. NRRL 66182]